MTETPLPQEPAAGLPIVVVAATDGRICYWSAGAEDLTGHLAAAAVGQPLDLSAY